jgi:hypothetical protein
MCDTLLHDRHDTCLSLRPAGRDGSLKFWGKKGFGKVLREIGGIWRFCRRKLQCRKGLHVPPTVGTRPEQARNNAERRIGRQGNVLWIESADLGFGRDALGVEELFSAVEFFVGAEEDDVVAGG